MSLIKCPTCGKEVTDNESTCPYCGKPLITVNNSRSIWKGLISPIIVVALIAVIIDVIATNALAPMPISLYAQAGNKLVFYLGYLTSFIIRSFVMTFVYILIPLIIRFLVYKKTLPFSKIIIFIISFLVMLATTYTLLVTIDLTELSAYIFIVQAVSIYYVFRY